jgi:hypothetical protein
VLAGWSDRVIELITLLEKPETTALDEIRAMRCDHVT